MTVSYFTLTARMMATDHHIHYYDARSLREPLFVLRGHDKAVSHIQFLDSSRLVSAYAPFTPLWCLYSSLTFLGL